MTSGWVELPQFRGLRASGYVALCLRLPGVVVTWFVTGFPNPGEVGDSHPLLLRSLLSVKARLRWRGIYSQPGILKADPRRLH